MSLWGCQNCKQLVHCSVPGICPVCGGKCTVVKQVTDNFDSLEFARELNRHLKTQTLKDAHIEPRRFGRDMADLFSKHLVEALAGQDFKLDVNSVWSKYSDASNLHIVTFTLQLQNRYFFSLIYSAEKDCFVVVPFHIDHYLEQYLLLQHTVL